MFNQKFSNYDSLALIDKIEQKFGPLKENSKYQEHNDSFNNIDKFPIEPTEEIQVNENFLKKYKNISENRPEIPQVQIRAKKPYLKRGEGLARFKLSTEDLERIRRKAKPPKNNKSEATKKKISEQNERLNSKNTILKKCSKKLLNETNNKKLDRIKEKNSCEKVDGNNYKIEDYLLNEALEERDEKELIQFKSLEENLSICSNSSMVKKFIQEPFESTPALKKKYCSSQSSENKQGKSPSKKYVFKSQEQRQNELEQIFKDNEKTQNNLYYYNKLQQIKNNVLDYKKVKDQVYFEDKENDLNNLNVDIISNKFTDQNFDEQIAPQSFKKCEIFKSTSHISEILNEDNNELEKLQKEKCIRKINNKFLNSDQVQRALGIYPKKKIKFNKVRFNINKYRKKSKSNKKTKDETDSKDISFDKSESLDKSESNEQLILKEATQKLQIEERKLKVENARVERLTRKLLIDRRNFENEKKKQELELENKKAQFEEEMKALALRRKQIDRDLLVLDKCNKSKKLEASQREEINNLKKEFNEFKEESKMKMCRKDSAICQLRSRIKSLEKDIKHLKSENEILKNEKKRLEMNEKRFKSKSTTNTLDIHNINKQITQLLINSEPLINQQRINSEPLKKSPANDFSDENDKSSEDESSIEEIKENETSNKNRTHAYFPEHYEASTSNLCRISESPKLSENKFCFEDNKSNSLKSLNKVVDSDLSSERKSNFSNQIEKRDVLHDGSEKIYYKNGNIRIQFPCGKYKKIFYNGDYEEVDRNSHIMKYYYKNQDILQITDTKNGIDTFRYPNGCIKKKFKNGEIEEKYSNGIVVSYPSKNQFDDQEKSYEKMITWPSGEKEIHMPDKKIVLIYTDGTRKILYADGSEKTIYSNGRIRQKDKFKNLILDTQN